jgi:predicted AAA+ superfamily ATPase
VSRVEDFKKVISEWFTRALPNIHERDIYIPLDVDVVISIVGPRRSGKTFMVYSLISRLERFLPRGNILYINMEHERLRHLSAEDLGDLITAYYEIGKPDGTKPIYLFLDEIQVVEGWSRWINRIYESKEYHIYLTGSTSQLLSREIATEMRGRSISYTVFPYSYREILKLKNIDIPDTEILARSEKRGEIIAVLEDYLQHGGYPGILDNLAIREKLLQSYIDAIVLRDVGERFNVEPLLLSYMFEYLSSSYSKYFSGSKAYQFLKTINYPVGKERPLQVLDYFNGALTVFPVEIFSRGPRAGKQYPRKIYLADNGLIEGMNGEVDLGRGMENLVFIELCRRSELFTRFSVFYWKEYGKSEGREVDFVIVKGGKVSELINVSYVRSREEVVEREIIGLQMASKELKCNDKTIITWDYGEDGNINYIPLWKWLLKK